MTAQRQGRQQTGASTYPGAHMNTQAPTILTTPMLHGKSDAIRSGWWKVLLEAQKYLINHGQHLPT
jgi:hypothetical protein